MSYLNDAIEEIKLSLLNNKSDEVKEVYLRNAIRIIEEAQRPKLNENQEIVIEWLKENAMVWELENIFSEAGGEILNAYDALTYREQFEVLQVFGQWGLETTK